MDQANLHSFQWATINQFMSNLVCEGFFYHILLKYGDENAEMQKRKFDDVTLQYYSVISSK